MDILKAELERKKRQLEKHNDILEQMEDQPVTGIGCEGPRETDPSDVSGTMMIKTEYTISSQQVEEPQELTCYAIGKGFTHVTEEIDNNEVEQMHLDQPEVEQTHTNQPEVEETHTDQPDIVIEVEVQTSVTKEIHDHEYSYVDQKHEHHTEVDPDSILDSVSLVFNSVKQEENSDSETDGVARFCSSLGEEEENRLTVYLQFLSLIGYRYTQTEVRTIAVDYIASLHSDYPNEESTVWLNNILDKWPADSGCCVDREKYLSKECVQRYFAALTTVVKNLDLNNKPEMLYIVGEIGLDFQQKTPCAVNMDSVSTTSNSGMSATMIWCGNADGVQLPPFFVSSEVSLRLELVVGSSGGAGSTLASTGSSTCNVFQQYIEDHLVKYVQRDSETQPVLLLYYGHNVHISVALCDMAKRHNIFLFVLPAYASDLKQGCFDPFNSILNDLYIRTTAAKKKHSRHVCELVGRAYNLALHEGTLKLLFKTIGVYPLDASAAERLQVVPESDEPSSPLADPIEQEHPTSNPDRYSSSSSDYDMSFTSDSDCSDSYPETRVAAHQASLLRRTDGDEWPDAQAFEELESQAFSGQKPSPSRVSKTKKSTSSGMKTKAVQKSLRTKERKTNLKEGKPKKSRPVLPQRSSVKRYRSYTQESLLAALKAVKEEKMPVLKASKIFKVPATTIRDRVLGKVEEVVKRSGPAPLLNEKEEFRLVEHLMSSSSHKYSRVEVINIATKFAVLLNKRDPEKPLTLQWYYNFMNRWPELRKTLCASKTPIGPRPRASVAPLVKSTRTKSRTSIKGAPASLLELSSGAVSSATTDSEKGLSSAGNTGVKRPLEDKYVTELEKVMLAGQSHMDSMDENLNSPSKLVCTVACKYNSPRKRAGRKKDEDH